jgi:flagellar biosynthesis regulator FlbT
LIGARRDAVNDENNFRTKINELVGELRKGEIVAANAAIDGAIRIKDGQKAHFAKMQEGLQAMERLDEGELADFIKIIKNRT